MLNALYMMKFAVIFYEITLKVPTLAPSVNRSIIHCKELTQKKNSLNIEDLEQQYRIYVPEEYSMVKNYFDSDGYDPNTNTVYEFDGDTWHGNPMLKYFRTGANPINGIKYIELHFNTLARDQFYRDMGYNLVTIWESEWNNSL